MTEKPVVFIADPVDEDGNVIGTASMQLTSSLTGPLDVVKIPHDEMALDDDAFHIRMPDPDDA